MRAIRRTAVIGLAAVAVLAAACGSGGAANSGAVTLTWWHNGTSDPLKSAWQHIADDYHSAHPGVSFQVDPIQNEQFPTKVPLALQSDTPPDIYQQWGGGDEASQVTSGRVADITSDTASWIGELGSAAKDWQVGGKQYGVPYDLHAVGFWYRKDIFANAGITTPPTTMAQLGDDVTKLRQSGVAPIAIGSKDQWPDGFYWEYFAIRECPSAVVKKQVAAKSLTDPCWTRAGNDLSAFLATNPFQTGFLGTPSQQGAGSSAGLVANGQAAMELQGDWEPGTMASLTQDKDIDSKLGWFPFPSVPGGGGDAGTLLGGGDGFSCTTRAASACADFLRYVDSTPVQKELAVTGTGLPANPAAASALTDPTLKSVLAYYQKADYVQMYFDRALPTDQGQQLNDAIANFFAGKGTARSIPQAVSQSGTGDR